jgi:DNA modification methylase
MGFDSVVQFERADFVTVHVGDCLDILKDFPDQKYDTCVTSPPYFNQRDYGIDGQIGLEKSPADYLDRLTAVFSEVYRVLRNDGTCWLNIGDSYAYAAYPPMGIKARDLLGIPWRLAFRLQQAGWYLRQDIIWDKPDTMPEPAKNRCVRSHEYLFLLSKQPRYYFDWQAIREIGVSGRKSTAPQRDTIETHGKLPQSNGNKGINAAKIKMLREFEEKGYVTRNRRSVWHVSVQSTMRNKHFATFPPALIQPCIMAGSRYGGEVLDPFCGSGTTGVVAKSLGRRADLIELNPEYAQLAADRCR